MNIIHLVQNKENENYEENALVYLESVIRYNPDFLENKIIFRNPSKIPLSDRLYSKIKNNNIILEEQFIESFQKNTEENFSVIPKYCYEQSRKLKGHILWLDIDIIFLNSNIMNIEKNDKIYLTLIPLKKQEISYDNLIKDIIEKEINKDSVLSFSNIYKHLFYPYLNNKYHIEEINKYANTWMLFGNSSNIFWKEWYELSLELLEIIHSKFSELIPSGIESVCEEIAASILYNKNPDNFIQLDESFSYSDENFSDKTQILHYEEFSYCKKSKKVVLELIKTSKVEIDLLKKNKIDIKYIMEDR